MSLLSLVQPSSSLLVVGLVVCKNCILRDDLSKLFDAEALQVNINQGENQVLSMSRISRFGESFSQNATQSISSELRAGSQSKQNNLVQTLERQVRVDDFRLLVRRPVFVCAKRYHLFRGQTDHAENFL